MKGPWKVTSNLIGNEVLYRVYRLLDTEEVDHSGNREYYGPYTQDRYKATTLANELNQIDHK